MKGTMSIQVHRLQPLDGARLRALASTMSGLQYTSESTFGFRDIFLQDDWLSAILVKRTATTIRVFEPQTRELVDREIFLFAEVCFALDGQRQLLEIFGPAVNTSKVRASLRPLLGNDFTLETVALAPVDTVPRLVMRLGECTVHRLSINNFEHCQGVVGRYDIRRLGPEFASDALSRYNRDVTRASLSCSIENIGTLELIVSSSGRLQITGEQDLLDPAYSAIKAALFDEE